MAIQGSLEEASLPDVLQLLALGRKTGCLSLTEGSLEGQIFLDKGLVCHAAIANRRDRLGVALVKGGKITRKQLDQNFDGRSDTTHHYDPVTHQLSQVTEDSNHDGAIDSWTDYREGSVVRRRVDSNGDGSADTWSYYRNGKIARHEQDTTGDGFRDRAGFYRGGRLSHEELDSNADGLADITNHYDGREQLTRREEDTDLDGEIDVISHYEGGRLARKELLGDTESIRR